MTFVNTTRDLGAEMETDYISETDRRDADILLTTTNIADQLPDEELTDIGNWVVDIYNEDLDSRSTWEENNKKWLKLANQLIEQKNFPWRNASNVKYPLLSVAAIQFHARAFSALIPNDNIVKVKVLGEDPDQKKKQVANRIARHMSYQVLYEMEDWQDEFDRALYILPIIGLVYKKSYYSSVEGTNVSELILPDDLVINYHAPNFKRAIKTHRIYQDANEVKELMNLGHYRTVDLDDPVQKPHEGVEDEITGISLPHRNKSIGVNSDNEDGNDYSDVPYTILEAHTWWDLDGDGYKEPYIITVEEESRKVLRLVARYKTQDIAYNDKGEILRIKPAEYFTRFGFLPNPESKIYYQGFGQLLGPLNAASNTILNQLIDAGTLANLPGGFLGRGMKMRGGEIKMEPGKWHHLPIQGDDIRKNIYPLPYKEPSTVLFQLLGMVIQSGERLSSVQDIMTGENPGQNQPYSTSIVVLEQGMKVFSGIYRRIYRALGQEFKKLFHLNRLFVDEQKYFQLMDDENIQQVTESDYALGNMDVVPGADPNIISEAHKVMKANSLLQKKAAGLPINTMVVTRAVLEAEGHDNLDELLQPDPPMEDPKITMEREKIASMERIEMAKMQIELITKEHEAFKDYAQAISHLAKAQATAEAAERDNLKLFADNMVRDYEAYTQRLKVLQDQATLAQKQQETKKSTKEVDTE